MKYNQNRRIFRMFYAATASVTLLTGFTSLAAEKDAFTADTGLVQEEAEERASWILQIL